MQDSFKSIFIIILLIILSIESSAQRTSFFVSAPQYAGQKMAIQGFNLFQPEILDSLIFDPSGRASCSLRYTGLAILNAGNDVHFPVILGHEDLSVEISAESNLKVNGGNRENEFLYRNLRQLVSLLTLKSELARSLSKSAKEAITSQELRLQILNEERVLSNFSQMLKDSSNYYSARLLLAKLVLDSASVCRDTASIRRSKDILLNFLCDNLGSLQNSDVLRKFAERFMVMNDWGSYTPEEYNQHFIEDIEAWITHLDHFVTREEIIKQFLTMALNIYYVTPAGALLESFPKEVVCSATKQMQHLSSSVDDVPFALWNDPGKQYRMSSLKGGMVLLIFIDPDCKATIPAHVIVTRYLKEKKIGIPYITVFNSPSPEKLSKWLPAIGLYCDAIHDPAMRLVSYSEIEQYPAFVVLDSEFNVEKKFYTLPEIKSFLRSLSQDRD